MGTIVVPSFPKKKYGQIVGHVDVTMEWERDKPLTITQTLWNIMGHNPGFYIETTDIHPDDVKAVAAWPKVTQFTLRIIDSPKFQNASIGVTYIPVDKLSYTIPDPAFS